MQAPAELCQISFFVITYLDTIEEIYIYFGYIILYSILTYSIQKSALLIFNYPDSNK